MVDGGARLADAAQAAQSVILGHQQGSEFVIIIMLS
jgi:hypothetical protein